jgi:hypothetical protein
MIYREFNCNLKAPKIYCDELLAKKMVFDEYGSSEVHIETGGSLSGKQFVIAPALLASSNCAAELTVYLVAENGAGAGLLMCTVIKAGGVIDADPLGVNAYQRVNAGMTLTASRADNSSVQITSSIPCRMSWIFRGY